MSRIATQADFEGGAIYTQYQRFSCFAARAAYIRETYPTVRSILVAGCAWGFLVEELRGCGLNAWGVDVSLWAVRQAKKALTPDSAARILLGDCTSPSDMQGVCFAAHLDQFDLVITEDLLPMCDDGAEARAIVQALRAIGRSVLHLISCDHPGQAHTAALLWQTYDAWVALCEGDAVIDAEDGRIA